MNLDALTASARFGPGPWRRSTSSSAPKGHIPDAPITKGAIIDHEKGMAGADTRTNPAGAAHITRPNLRPFSEHLVLWQINHTL